MSNGQYGRGLYPFVGLSTDSKSPTSDLLALTWTEKPYPGQRAFETDTENEYKWTGITWKTI